MRRLLLSTVVTALTGALLTVAPSPAHAAGLLVDAGPLAPDTVTTLALAADDTTQLSIEVPPGALPTITMTAVTPGASVQVVQNNTFSFANVSGDQPTTWYAELGRNFRPDPSPDLLFISTFGADAQVTFVLRYATDTSQDLTPGTPATVTLQNPGARALLSVDASLMDSIRVHVSDVQLTGSIQPVDPAYTVYSSSPFFGDGPPLTEVAPGEFEPLTAGQDGPFTIVVDPASDRTGSLTVSVDITPGTVGALSYGQATEIPLDRPGRVRRYSLTTSASAGTLLHAFAPNLTTSDGTPGSATFELLVGGATVPAVTGTISDQALVTVDAGVLPDGTDAVLRVTAGPGTSGSFSIVPQLDPGPSTALTVGSPNPVSLPGGTATTRYSVTAEQGEQFEYVLQDIAISDPDALPFVQISLESPLGFREFPAFVSAFPAQRSLFSFTADLPGEWTIEISRPDFVNPVDPSSFSATLLPLKRTVARQDLTLPVDATVSVTAPAQVLEVHVPALAGHRYSVLLTDPAFVPADETGRPPFVSIDLAGVAEGNVVESRPGGGAGPTYLETGPLGQDGDLVVRVDPEGLATGSIHLSVYEPQDTTGSLAAAGTPTTATIARAGDRARFTFEGTAGDPFALDVPQIALGADENATVRIRISGPNGALVDTQLVNGRQGWLELPTGFPPVGLSRLPDTGTYTVEVDPGADAVGSVVLTRTQPRPITTPVKSGQQVTLTFQRGDVQRLTFTGKAGQRPVLRFSASTVEPGETAVALLDPSGQPVQQLADFEVDSRYQELQTLTSAGTWTIELNPTAAFAGSTTVRFDLVTDPVKGVDPGVLTKATWGVGENPTYRVKLKAGERIAVDVRSIANFTPGGSATVVIIGPDGFGQDFGQVGVPGSLAGLPPLWLEAPGTAQSDGTWTVQINGAAATTGSVSFVVWTAADQVIPNRVGRATNVNIARPVQQVVLPFTVTNPGRPVSWKVTGSTFTEARLLLIGPFGFAVDAATIGPGDRAGTFFEGPFSRGTWSLVLDPIDGGTGKANITFTYAG